MNNVEELLNKLIEKGLTIGSVESFTGGLFSKTLTDVPGASNCFKGSIVSYSKELKESLVEIPASYIEEHGVVSWEVAQQMAIKGKRILGVDVCVSFTGNAGPDVCEYGTKAGEVYIGIVYNGQIWPIPLNLQMSREEVREYAVQTAVNALLSIIN